jgi:FCD domain
VRVEVAHLAPQPDVLEQLRRRASSSLPDASLCNRSGSPAMSLKCLTRPSTSSTGGLPFTEWPIRPPRPADVGALQADSRLMAENVEQHGAVLAAIEARDPEAARAAMCGHVRAGELIARWVEQR